MVERIGFITGLDSSRKAMHSHIHQAELGIVGDFLLSIECHRVVGAHAGMVHKVTGLHEHTTRTTRRIQQDSRLRLQHIDDHLDQRFRRKEHAIIRGDILSKFIQEILIDPADNISTDIIQCFVVEYPQQFSQEFIRKIGIIFRQDSLQLFFLFFDEFHGIVDDFAQAPHRFSSVIFKTRRSDVFRQIDQVFILRFFRKIQGTLFLEIACLHRQHTAAAHRTVFQDFFLCRLVPAVSIPQENQAQHRHAILV